MILKRLFRVLLASSVGRAWAQKSPKWLSVAAGILLFRFIDKRAATSGAQKKKGKHA
ncbi:MAG: hypothetical protein WCK12_01865 [Acidimicrobiaceae bacterium]